MNELSIVWIRPWASLVLLPWFAALYWWWRSTQGHGRWQHLVDAHLLSEVTQPAARGAQKPLLILGIVLGVLISTALAGPSWRTPSAPLFRDLTARVVILDLSPSMMSFDATANRLALAKSIVTTLLQMPRANNWAWSFLQVTPLAMRLPCCTFCLALRLRRSRAPEHELIWG